MHRPTTLAFLAAVTAGGLAVAGATGATPAALAATATPAAPALAATATPAGHPAIRASYTRGSAGYVTGGGWRFRYVGASLKIPACRADPASNAGAAISLSGDTRYLPSIHTRYLASIAVVCGGGAHSVGYFDRRFGSGAFRLSPDVGDVLTIRIYHQAGHDYFTATDTTAGTTQTVAVATPAVVVYRHATLLASIHATRRSVAASDLRLWEFRNTSVTSASGKHGTLSGPWATYQLIGTADGTAAGRLTISASYPSGNGRQFSVWLRH